MIKLYCDMCGEEVDSLYSINSKIKYRGAIQFKSAIDMEAFIFDDMNNKAENNFQHKQVCKVCKEMLFATTLDTFNEFVKLMNDLINEGKDEDK